MNPYEVFNDKNQILLKEAGISFENKDYNCEDCKFMFHKVIEYIMSHSKKEIQHVSNEYNIITDTFEKIILNKEKEL